MFLHVALPCVFDTTSLLLWFQDCQTLLPKWWWTVRDSVTPQTLWGTHWTPSGTSTMTCECTQHNTTQPALRDTKHHNTTSTKSHKTTQTDLWTVSPHNRKTQNITTCECTQAGGTKQPKKNPTTSTIRHKTTQKITTCMDLCLCVCLCVWMWWSSIAKHRGFSCDSESFESSSHVDKRSGQVTYYSYHNLCVCVFSC